MSSSSGLTTLYKKSTTGKIQEWSIELQGNSYRTISGYVDGAKTTSEWTICAGKNIGRANETTPSQQASSEVQSAITKKKDKGYSDTIENAKRPTYFEPMLAKEYEGKISFPVFCQPKLDGIRCIVTKDGMFSRNGKPIVAAPHIFEQLGLLAAHYNMVFDGELYNHDLKDDFDQICSLARKTKPEPEDLQLSERLLEYHIYDCFLFKHPQAVFSERNDTLNYIFYNTAFVGIDQVDTHDVVNTHFLDKFYENYVSAGYEGQMVRLDVPYENKRTKNLLKRKEFKDGEWTILDIVEGEGNRSGMAGYMCFQQGDMPFKANIKGDRAYLRELLANKQKYIGARATIKYFNLTPRGVPRFPCVVKIRAEIEG